MNLVTNEVGLDSKAGHDSYDLYVTLLYETLCQ